MRVRTRVFIEEQGVPPELEQDDLDPGARHLLAEDSAGRPIGTLRILDGGQIGRMAVLPAWRRHGVGSALMHTALARLARPGSPRPFLNAQTRAIPFYRRFGFVVVGPEFMEAGIPHRRMELNDG
ncbi:MAG TPA: GNAT family N-acetyltransferase [Sedimenticola sp.]|nr:GNAT family N-acetyltransferase [Sedimenticola sp.]